MFWKRDSAETQLDRTIAQLELDIQMTPDQDAKESAKKIKNLERLYALKSKNAPKGLDPNTLLLVGGNLAGILIIVGYEHGHVIVSKAIGFAGKLR